MIHACAIMPDHVHLVVARHQLNGDDLLACIKRAATRGLNDEGLHPMREYPRANGRLPSPWGARGWKVMLFASGEVQSRIRYVERESGSCWV
jgi:REP element-mobilizing transposase RayT